MIIPFKEFKTMQNLPVFLGGFTKIEIVFTMAKLVDNNPCFSCFSIFIRGMTLSDDKRQDAVKIPTHIVIPYIKRHLWKFTLKDFQKLNFYDMLKDDDGYSCPQHISFEFSNSKILLNQFLKSITVIGNSCELLWLLPNTDWTIEKNIYGTPMMHINHNSIFNIKSLMMIEKVSFIFDFESFDLTGQEVTIHITYCGLLTFDNNMCGFLK
jgi:hypothetical protein